MTNKNETKTNTKNRRTNAERDEHIAFAKRMLDLNVPSYAIALQMQKRFSICRSSAFRDIAIANNERASKDEGGLKATPPAMEMRDVLINILFQSVLDASTESDAKTLPRLTKEIRELMKLGGPGVGRHPEAGPDNEEPLVSLIQNIYKRRTEQEKAEQETQATQAQGHA